MWSDLDRPPLRERELRRGLLPPIGPWAALDVVEETGSTNADLVAAARAGAPDRTVLVAEHQTAGRGRNARVWTQPPRAGIAFSVLLRPGVPLARWSWAPLLAGVAVAEAVARIGEVDARLKWPNDVLVGGRKLAGVLAEVADVADGAAGPAVVIGVGVNVTTRPDELPAGVDATSLAQADAACVYRDPVLRAVLRRLADLDEQWRAAGGDPVASGLHAAYTRHCATLGSRVRVALPAGAELVGDAVAIDPDGRLVVRGDDGATTAVSAGDVAHVRRAAR